MFEGLRRYLMLVGLSIFLHGSLFSQISSHADSEPISIRIIPPGAVENRYGKQIDEDCKLSPLFAEKDEFETTSQYQLRLKRAKKYRDSLLLKYTVQYERWLLSQQELKTAALLAKQEKIRNSLTREPFEMELIGPYNADAEIFEVRIRGVNYDLKVPLSEAKSFKELLPKSVCQLDKQLKEDGVTWDYFNYSITHPVTGTVYRLNQKKPLYH